MSVSGIGADHDNDIGFHHRIEILGAGAGAESLAQTKAGGRMTDAGAGIDIVVLEGLTHQLLHQIGFFIGAARGGDGAHRRAAEFLLDAGEFRRDALDRFVPRHFAPRIGDAFTDHGLGDAVAVAA